MKPQISPTPGMGQVLDNDRHTSNFSKITQQTKDIKCSKILIGIVNKWFSMGIYPSTNSAFIALLEGLL
jgi:hypothetical protein